MMLLFSTPFRLRCQPFAAITIMPFAFRHAPLIDGFRCRLRVIDITIIFRCQRDATPLFALPFAAYAIFDIDATFADFSIFFFFFHYLLL